MERIAKLYPEMAKQASASPTWQQQLLAKGWGYAIYIPPASRPTKVTDSRRHHRLVNKGQPRSSTIGARSAPGLGASRCLDYFETDKSVDAKQVGITGHSRYGKASLVAMAYDPRFAIGSSAHRAGGAELYRRNFGEQMGNLAGTGEYHWFAGNFIKYDGPLAPKDLPVDSHELIALCAPRPVFIGGGATQGDGWVDAKGTFLAAVGAGPVYKLLGKKDLGTVESGQFARVTNSRLSKPRSSTATSPSANTARPHTSPNWPTFLTSRAATPTAPTPTINRLNAQSCRCAACCAPRPQDRSASVLFFFPLDAAGDSREAALRRHPRAELSS